MESLGVRAAADISWIVREFSTPPPSPPYFVPGYKKVPYLYKSRTCGGLKKDPFFREICNAGAPPPPPVADIPPPPPGSDLLYKLPKFFKFHEFNRNSFDHVAKVLLVHLLTCSSPLTLDIAYDHIKATNTVLNKDNHHFYFNKYFTAKWVSLHEHNTPILTYLIKYRNRHQTAVTVCRDIHCLGR